MSNEHIQLTELLYNKLKLLVSQQNTEKEISASNIIVIIDTAMKLAGKLKNLSGYEKKTIVLTVVKKLIDESTLKDSDAEVVKIIAERALDPTIDQLFAMAPELYGKTKKNCLNLCKK